MNGSTYSHDPSSGYYTGTGPIYRNNYPSTFTPNSTNIYDRHSYSPPVHEIIHSQQINQANTLNQRHLYRTNLQQQQQQQRVNFDTYSVGNNNESPSTTAYYDRIHSQVRSNTPSSNPTPFPSSESKPTREPTRTRTNDPIKGNLLVAPEKKPTRTSPRPKPPTPSPTPIFDHPASHQLTNDDDPSLDYPHYTMDSLIQQLVPSDTYIPKQSFIYPMLMCSRTNIRPSLLLNKLARLTIDSITYMTIDRSVRTMKNFLYVLSQWTRIFPYDFRNSEMMSQLEDLLKKISSYEPILQSDVHHINKKLRSKLKALENYEEYIRQLNQKALNSLPGTALFTDIMNECPTSILFAQQLTHIELDRLKPIGAEELIQYFIMKLASEEARAHPNRNYNDQTTTSNVDNSNNNHKMLNFVHDKKLTFCLEAYVQWFNRLTFFITTEIVKHTQRRLRIRLINYFIDAAYECFRLHNFNSMIGIIGGLNMQPVKRLKRTWGKIQLDKLEQLEQYTNVSRNFANYRLVLKAAMEEAEKHSWATDVIVIPFTSIILQDVYYIKTHSKDYTTEGGINLKKYYSMAKFISEDFVQCKQSKCSFERNDVIINYIITSPTFNENSLMLASFECEPPATPNEKEKCNMLQSSA